MASTAERAPRAGEDTLTVGPDRAGQRLDRLVAAIPSVGSRQRAREALETGKILVDGQEVGAQDGARPLPAGAILEVQWSRPGSSARKVRGREALERAGVRVLYQDEGVIAVDKPAGLLTDAASEEQRRDEDTLKKRVRGFLGGDEAHVVHRLDRDTTGVVLFARTLAAAQRLDQQIHRQTPERVYLALVTGSISQVSGRFADWMFWDRAQRIQRSARPGAPDAVLAEADWRVVERLGLATLLEVRLVTGRRNQIRLHCALMGHPIVGERLYRDARAPRGPTLPRQALHATRLGVQHPLTGRPLVVESPLPDDMRQLMDELRRGAGPSR